VGRPVPVLISWDQIVH